MKRKGVIKEICHGYYPLIPINSGNAEPAFVTASSAASPSAPPAASASKSVISLIDYKDVDYRGFVFVVHGTHGLLLLHCTRKKKKGSHYQLPGGHVDDNEFESSGKLIFIQINRISHSFATVNFHQNSYYSRFIFFILIFIYCIYSEDMRRRSQDAVAVCWKGWCCT